jgi:hypothetical protein
MLQDEGLLLHLYTIIRERTIVLIFPCCLLHDHSVSSDSGIEMDEGSQFPSQCKF